MQGTQHATIFTKLEFALCGVVIRPFHRAYALEGEVVTADIDAFTRAKLDVLFLLETRHHGDADHEHRHTDMRQMHAGKRTGLRQDGGNHTTLAPRRPYPLGKIE